MRYPGLEHQKAEELGAIPGLQEKGLWLYQTPSLWSN
jgi:hypothetical protein